MNHPTDETLGLYVGGLLGERERAEVDAHAAGCGSCARAIEELVEMNDVLGRLPAVSVPGSIRDRIGARLLLDGGPKRVAAWRAAAAAAILFVLGGFVGMALSTPDPAPDALVRDADGPKFALIFAEEYESLTGAPPVERSRRMAEFMAWMRGIGDASVQLGGSELDDTRGRIVGASTAAVAPGVVLSGFLVIRATSYDQAEEIARRCPIVARGGQVIVRQLK